MITKPFIAIQTDFSLNSSGASLMHSVCYQVDPELRVEDITHGIPKFNMYLASITLDRVLPYWPIGTIFISVVDPGVGTARKSVIAKTKNRYYIVTPDNGTLTHAYYNYGIEEIREIDGIHRYPESENNNIFHGRDIFAYTAAKLASGKILFEEVGEKYSLDKIVLFELPKNIIRDDGIDSYISGGNLHFGLVTSNITLDDLKKINGKRGDYFDIQIKNNDKLYFKEKVLFHNSFGFVDRFKPILYTTEDNKIGLALNQDNFFEKYDVSIGPEWKFSLIR
jgi:S-adenosylmethionine hydrolase